MNSESAELNRSSVGFYRRCIATVGSVEASAVSRASADIIDLYYFQTNGKVNDFAGVVFYKPPVHRVVSVLKLKPLFSFFFLVIEHIQLIWDAQLSAHMSTQL